MKARIILSLILLLTIMSGGIFLSVINLGAATEELTQVIDLHEVEQIRRALVINVQAVQSNLYTANTPHAADLDAIIENVIMLTETSESCTSCHHTPIITNRVVGLQSLIRDYEDSLSFYLTTSANEDRLKRLKRDAVELGVRILAEAENMSHAASDHLREITEASLTDVSNISTTLHTTFLVCIGLSAIFAALLIRSVTKPIGRLLAATRNIESGDFDARVDYDRGNEFGELARGFNTMSARVGEEIEQHRKTTESLRQSQERYAVAAAGSNDGLWDVDLQTGVFYFSARCHEMLGLGDNQQIGTRWEDLLALIHEDDRSTFESKMWNHVKSRNAHLEHEVQALHTDGSYRWILMRGSAVRDSTGRAQRMAGSVTDITERKITARQLLYDAFHDPLTRLPNRALFMDRLTHVVNRTIRSEKKPLFAVLFIGLDRFQLTSESLGHQAAEEVLKQVAERLKTSVRPADTVARFVGDEFAILLEDIDDLEMADKLTGRISSVFSPPFEVNDDEVFVSASTGVAYGNSAFEKPEDLLRNADIAMYKAKSDGGGRHEVFRPEMLDGVLGSVELDKDMRNAIENDEFQLYYQPIVSLTTGQILGFEALIRWAHPTRGMVSPDDFIPIAEQNGLILQIGSWVLKQACSQIAEWQETHIQDSALKISVNVSAKQFSQDLVEQVKEVLRDTSIPPNTLGLEITETALMGDRDEVIPILHELKALGVELHIDDFGTGYSSLSSLHDYPVDVLKIDRSFVHNLSLDAENYKIVRTIKELAVSLNMAVTAEGVETIKQMEILKELDCNNLQGYLFSKPIPHDDMGTQFPRVNENLLELSIH